MAFIWTNEKIKFFKDASLFTGFHRQVGEIIRPYLDVSWTLCDLGCGLGFLDFAIAPFVKEIIAIDSSDIAVNDYKSRLAESDIKNIRIELEDFDKISGESWDAVLLSFFGKPGKELDRIFGMVKNTAIVITYEEPLSKKHGKLKSGDNRPTTLDHETYLKNRGYEYEIIREEMDFGQPFRTLDDARLYFESYSREKDPTERNSLIKKNLENVKATDTDDFPYFLSKRKGIGIFIVKM